MTDPLAQYRKKPVLPTAKPSAPTPTAETPEGYAAFDAKDKVDRLSIRHANQESRTPAYGYLLDITHDGPYGCNFVLYFSFKMVVLVEGRNLQPVIKAVQMGTAEFIQEYDADRWPKPTDEKTPFIESITIFVEQDGPTLPDEIKKAAKERSQGRSLH